MALKEIRKIQDRSKKVYMHYLVAKGKLKQYVSEKGYVCYDTDEYREYKKNGYNELKAEPKKLKGEYYGTETN